MVSQGVEHFLALGVACTYASCSTAYPEGAGLCGAGGEDHLGAFCPQGCAHALSGVLQHALSRAPPAVEGRWIAWSGPQSAYSSNPCFLNLRKHGC